MIEAQVSLVSAESRARVRCFQGGVTRIYLVTLYLEGMRTIEDKID